ncbi:uncharacterized protein LOC134818531 [Bolinopsis microptera]|uniref:uncharacterized protein LOC134818531 n=1 Tax=Bolinopsis microptera TaxID=2820187 RepID=UPI0030797217
MRWRRQVNSNSDRTPIYSRTCISSVCLLIICTYLPSDFIHMLQLLYRLQILPNLKWADQSDTEALHKLLLSENLKMISDIFKYIFVGLFPLFLLVSKQFRALLAVEAYRKREFLVKRISRILKAEAGKRSSVISVTSAGGAQRSFSVVINEHHLCLHAHELNELRADFQQECLPNQSCLVKSSLELVKIPLDCDYTTDYTDHVNSVARMADCNAPAIDLSCLKIDLHQLHTTFDEFCVGCVREKHTKLKECKKKKIVKIRPGRLISDNDKKDVGVKTKHDKCTKYKVKGTVVKTNVNAGDREGKDRRITTTSLGQVELFQIENTITNQGTGPVLVDAV